MNASYFRGCYLVAVVDGCDKLLIIVVADGHGRGVVEEGCAKEVAVDAVVLCDAAHVVRALFLQPLLLHVLQLQFH